MSDALIGGIDEVGRGCLAGPILAVAAVFDGNASHATGPSPVSGLKDSKKFSSDEARREVYRTLLRSGYLIDFGIGTATSEEINRVGIDEANALVFCRALDDLLRRPSYIYVDGVKPVRNFGYSNQLYTPKADGLYWPVSAASILAKTIRDDIMTELGDDYPEYDWANNAGYGTQSHKDALLRLGPTKHHRTQFIRKILESR